MNKKVKKEISEINEKLDKLISSGIFKKAERCDFLEQNLKNIKLKVSRIKPVLFENNMGVTIEYEIAPVTIYLDGENVYPNETFKSINFLDLISYEDMNKIQKKIEDIIELQKRQ